MTSRNENRKIEYRLDNRLGYLKWRFYIGLRLPRVVKVTSIGPSSGRVTSGIITIVKGLKSLIPLSET